MCKSNHDSFFILRFRMLVSGSLVCQGIIWCLTWGLFLLSIVLEADPNNQTISIRVNYPSFSTYPFGLFALTIYYLTIYTVISTFSKKNMIGNVDKLIIMWFLHNGGIIHIVMEGLAAGWGLWPEIYESYQLIDNRFRFHVPDFHGGAPDEAKLNVWLITQLELYVWAPFCVLTVLSYYGVLHQRHRHGLAIVTSMMQIIGTIFFVFSPLFHDCMDLPPFGVKGCLPELDWFTLIYVYLAFGINFVWVIIPSMIIWWCWPIPYDCDDNKKGL